MFKASGDNQCKVCKTGEYQLQVGQESCDICPENHYCPVSLYKLQQTPGLRNVVDPWKAKGILINGIFILTPNIGSTMLEGNSYKC